MTVPRCILFQLAEIDSNSAVVILTADERAAIAVSKAAASRGEFATDEQIRAVWANHDTPSIWCS